MHSKHVWLHVPAYNYVHVHVDRSKRRRSGRLTPRYVMQLKDGEALYNVLRSASDPDSLLVRFK